jgi:hypothetical protein
MTHTAMTRAEAAQWEMVEAAGTDRFAMAHLAFVDAVKADEAYWAAREEAEAESHPSEWPAWTDLPFDRALALAV